MTSNDLPFLYFARPTLTDAMGDAIKETLLSHQITSGPQVLAFEQALSDYHGGRATRVFTSATAAMEVAFQVIGVQPGDEIITSAMTFFSVGNMIEKMGARTVFVDCDLVTRNIALDQIVDVITPKTRAIVPTHFSGLPCDMDVLNDMADEFGIRVVEDAALAIGSSWHGRKIGSFGDIATFSFHPNKNMTSIEGGAAVFADEAEARRAEVLRFHGISRRADGTRDVDFPGGKFNLSDVSARLGLEQLIFLDAWCAKRRQLVDHYFSLLEPAAGELGLVLPAKAHPEEYEGHSWNMFCVLLPLTRMTLTRKQFIDKMAERRIGIGISYEAMHLSTLFRSKGHRDGEFPNAERIARETVTLPLFPAMTMADVERAASATLTLLREHRSK